MISDAVKVEVAWGDDPHAVSPTWVDVAADALRISAQTSSRASEFDGMAAGRLVVELADFDRDYDPTYASSPYVNDFLWGTPIRVRGLEEPSTWHVVWQGWCTRFTPSVATGSPTTRVEAVDGLGLLAEWNLPVQTAADGGDDTPTRIGAILTDANWPAGDRDLDPESNVLAATVHGRTALAEIQVAAVAGGGLVYHQPADNTLAYESRHGAAYRTRFASSQKSFGGAGETGIVHGSLVLAGVGDTFRNIVRITDSGGTVSTAGSVTATQTERAIARSVELSQGGEYLANFLLDLHDTETPTPARWSTDAYLAGTAVDDDVLAVRLRDRVNVEWDVGPGAAENDDVIVNSISHEIEPGRWRVTFTAEAATPYDGLDGADAWLVLNDATDGKVDTGKLGY